MCIGELGCSTDSLGELDAEVARWSTDRIEKLFNSIMRGYPIGTFLFWFVKGGTKNDYTF